MDPDGRPESHGAPSWRAGMSPSSFLLFFLHVQGYITTVALQLINMGQCRQGEPSLPGAWQSATAGCAGRTHVGQHVMPIEYELATAEGSLGLWETEGRRRGAGRKAVARRAADALMPRRMTNCKCTNTTSTKLVCMCVCIHVCVYQYMHADMYACK